MAKTVKPVIYIALGAGVQSTTLLVCSALGLHGVSRADFALFADTRCEPRYVYEHLGRCETFGDQHGIPVVRTSRGDLGKAIDEMAQGRSRRADMPPFFTAPKGILRRRCTREYKVRQILRGVREQLGAGPRSRLPAGVARAMIGFSVDEAHRMKDSRVAWAINTYPLIDAGLSRQDCEHILKDHGWGAVGRSACTFCPYHRNEYWRWLKANHPLDWEDACQADERWRDLSKGGVDRPVFLHQSRVPLRVADLGGTDEPDGFGNECEGGCGI